MSLSPKPSPYDSMVTQAPSRAFSSPSTSSAKYYTMDTFIAAFYAGGGVIDGIDYANIGTPSNVEFYFETVGVFTTSEGLGDATPSPGRSIGSYQSTNSEDAGRNNQIECEEDRLCCSEEFDGKVLGCSTSVATPNSSDVQFRREEEFKKAYDKAREEAQEKDYEFITAKEHLLNQNIGVLNEHVLSEYETFHPQSTFATNTVFAFMRFELNKNKYTSL